MCRVVVVLHTLLGCSSVVDGGLVQMQLVFVEISKDADLHCVMLQSESLYLEQYAVWKEMCKSFVIEVCEAKSW